MPTQTEYPTLVEASAPPEGAGTIGNPTEEATSAPLETITEEGEATGEAGGNSLELYLTLPAKGYLVGNQYAYMGGGNVQVVDLGTGSMRWTTNVGEGWLVHADEQFVYVKQAEQRVDAYDMQTGEFGWKVLLPAAYLAMVNYRDDQFGYIVTGDRTSGQVSLVKVDKANAQIIEIVDNIVPDISNFSVLAGYGDLMLFRASGQTGMELYGWSPEQWAGVFHFREDGTFRCNSVMISSTSSSARETKYEGYAARDGSLLWAKEFAETLHDNFYCSNEPGTHEAAMWLVMGAVGYEAERLVETQLPFFMTQQGDQLAAVAAQTGETVWTSAEHLGQGITFGREDWLGEVGNVLVYSSAAYGITQGYAAATHEFVWENASIQIDALLGSWQKVGVALAVGEYGGRTTVKTMYGLDLNTGEVLWTIEMGSQPLTAIEVVGEWVIWNSYYQTTKHEIHFVNVETGNERLMFPAASAGQGYFGQGEWIFVGTWEQIYLFR